MRIRWVLAAAVVAGSLVGTSAMAQQDTTQGDVAIYGKQIKHAVKKAASNTHRALTKAGNDTKAELHRDASKAHRALRKTGNATKDELGEVSGGEVSQDTSHANPVKKAASRVHHTLKKTGRHAKRQLRSQSSKAHHALKASGRDIKEDMKKGRDTTGTP